MESSVSVEDKDLKIAFHFMVSIVSILEEMTRDMIRQPAMGMNFSIFQERILKYAPTFDGMVEDFNDEIFGEYANRIDKAEFIDNMGTHGWKYFN